MITTLFSTQLFHTVHDSAIRTFHILCVMVQTIKMVVLCPDLAAAWEASALFDVFVSALTFSRTLKMRKVHTMANNSETGLLDLILRDGKQAKLHASTRSNHLMSI